MILWRFLIKSVVSTSISLDVLFSRNFSFLQQIQTFEEILMPINSP